jgi:hypothetical protein
MPTEFISVGVFLGLPPVSTEPTVTTVLQNNSYSSISQYVNLLVYGR